MRDWRPAVQPDMLAARSALNQQIRDFFQARNVLEVETPLLARSIGTDPGLQPITAQYQDHPKAENQQFYLQTSPEFAMKRLLAAGSGPIFQLCKAFRNGENGRRHNPEFTMLEWYRPGFTLPQLMAEVEALVDTVLGPQTYRRISYAAMFEQYLQLDIFQIELAELQQITTRHIDLSDPEQDRDTCLELLYSHIIEPELQDAVLIHDFPASQSALARISENAHGQKFALRFELIMHGMEIVNGYDELLDSRELQQRFVADQAIRRQRELPRVNEDVMLLQALEHGMPACCGVALGVDRLLMLKTGATEIEQVLAFPLQRI